MNPCKPIEFHFRGYWGCHSKCGIWIAKVLADGTSVVIATELPDNRGTSITNAAEIVAKEVCERFHISPDELIWIEHYPPRRAREAHSYDRVRFVVRANGDLTCPKWRPMTPDDWRALELPDPSVLPTPEVKPVEGGDAAPHLSFKAKDLMSQTSGAGPVTRSAGSG